MGDEMKVTAIETVHVAEFANVLWVRIETDEGLVGLGETFRNPEAVTAYIHETIAPYLLGKNALQVELHHHNHNEVIASHRLGFPTNSIETRGNSAVDMALWDIVGQAAGQPLYQLFGGLTKDRIRIYNTCAGSNYNNRRRSDYGRQLVRVGDRPKGQGGDHLKDDLVASIHYSDELAQSLLDEGITGMKIWPFDEFALETDGREISAANLRAAIKPIEKIRKAVGSAMDVMIEYHGMWTLPAARKICAAVDEFDVYWHEDPLRGMHNFDDLVEYAAATNAYVCGAEAMATLAYCREMLPRRALDVIHFDIGWTGGISEARRVIAMAEGFQRSIAPHDCTGPVTLTANTHLALSASNALILETVRTFYRGYYREVVDGLPRIEDGFAYPPTGTGIGVSLAPGLTSRADATVRRSNLEAASIVAAPTKGAGRKASAKSPIRNRKS